LSVEDVEHSGRPSTSKMIEKVEKIRTHLWRPLLYNPWAHRHCWTQLWSLPGNLNTKFEHALHCCEVCSLIVDKWSRWVARKRVPRAMREG
jgi:hypothetical protein